MGPWIVLVIVASAVFSRGAEGKRDEVLYCSACMAIADELNYSISKIDPKKTVHVGGFRLNPDGTLTDKKIINHHNIGLCSIDIPEEINMQICIFYLAMQFLISQGIWES
ncbi:hypothetical protein P4O66_014100 [Electrophorus voltai]|uniref:DUF3456 domain-containing protein n=1 Tax=Electrophorus voltai TaxID=2609070 RepID=A0AAD8Z0K0_9TELE|nr:hypothetical protein P4O66_014100 [Electrophorus voltai]